jgi:hypothetical protein
MSQAIAVTSAIDNVVSSIVQCFVCLPAGNIWNIDTLHHFLPLFVFPLFHFHFQNPEVGTM